MVVKVSVALPNGTVFTVEGDPDAPRPTLEYVVLDLAPRLLAVLSSPPPPTPTPAPRQPASAPAAPDYRPAAAPPAAATPTDREPNAAASGPAVAAPSPGVAPSLAQGGAGTPAEPEAPAPLEVPDHVRGPLVIFCRHRDPGGAMRRTVVAAEAAARYLGRTAVTTADLEQVFSLVGWPIPTDFSQTVRNAARRSFGWLQRDPEREGHYFVTQKGRDEVLGQAPQPDSDEE